MRKFTESIQAEISFETIEDILDELNEIESFVESKLPLLDNRKFELSRYSNRKKNTNDQIDDSVFSFETLSKDLKNSLENINKIKDNLMSYKEEGRKKLY